MMKDYIAVIIASISLLTAGLFGYTDLEKRTTLLEDHDRADIVRIQTVDAAPPIVTGKQ